MGGNRRDVKCMLVAREGKVDVGRRTQRGERRCKQMKVDRLKR